MKKNPGDSGSVPSEPTVTECWQGDKPRPKSEHRITISSSAVHKKYKPSHLHKASAAFLIQYLFSVHAQVQTDEWSMKYVSGSAG